MGPGCTSICFTNRLPVMNSCRKLIGFERRLPIYIYTTMVYVTPTYTNHMARQVLVQRKVTAAFCAEHILDRTNVSESFILKHQPHLTSKELTHAWVSHHNKHKHSRALHYAQQLSRDDKIFILCYKHKKWLDTLSTEEKHSVLRRMIRRMSHAQWIEILLEKAY